MNASLTNTVVQSLAICGTNLYAGTYGGLYYRPLSEMITGIKKEQNGLPKNFALAQNYPNPFNPSTTISFDLPSKSFVSLKVFDLIGRVVATIVSEELSAGTYSWQWNASTLSSGIYLYRLEAGSFTQTKKLVLIK